MKVLMLHGYAQTAGVFQRKFAATQNHLEAAFPGIKFHYLEAPFLLDPVDMPGLFNERQDTSIETQYDNSNPTTVESRAWFYLNESRKEPFGIRHSLDMAAETLRREGPFDGCIAFSQGTVIAGMITSLLEGSSRRQRYESFKKEHSSDVFAYPESFDQLDHLEFKFAIFYGGLMARDNQYQWLYSNPRVQTPICHFTGIWDPVVDGDETDALLQNLCSEKGPISIVHPGAHNIPITLQYSIAAANFIRSRMPCGIQGCRVRRDSIVHLPLEAQKPTRVIFTPMQGFGIRKSSASGRRLLNQGIDRPRQKPRKACTNDTQNYFQPRRANLPKYCPCCKRPLP